MYQMAYRQKSEVTLHDLARTGDIETFQTISLDQFNINEKDSEGYSPLTLAVYNGHREFSRYLLSLGADANSIDNSGNSVLMNAAIKGHYEIIKHLIEAGADVSFSNSEGQSALEFAQTYGQVEAEKVIQSYTSKPVEFNFLHTLKSWAAGFNYR